LTSNTGQLINDNRVQLPPSATYVPRDEQSNLAQNTSVADKVLKEQAEKLKKINDIKQQIAQNQDRIVAATLDAEKNTSSSNQLRLDALRSERTELEKELVKASESYSSTVSGQNNAPQKQSFWSK
jgi:hypothetical protein